MHDAIVFMAGALFGISGCVAAIAGVGLTSLLRLLRSSTGAD